MPIDGAVLGNDRAAADGLSVVWREGGVCQTLAGRGGDRAVPGRRADRLPCFGLPLRSGDESVSIDLNVLMQMVY